VGERKGKREKGWKRKMLGERVGESGREGRREWERGWKREEREKEKVGEREGRREKLRGRARRKREEGESLQTNTIDLKGVDKYCTKSLEMMLASSNLILTFKINKISSSHNSPARKK